MRVCKELMEMNGYNWKISKERRDLERNRLEEKEERIRRVQKLKRNIVETERRKYMQKKITESLGELPKNRRLLLEREMELERRLLLKEAKEDVWKKWRQNKGRRGKNPKINTREDRNPLEEKLKRIEMEVVKYKETNEQKRQEEEQRHNDQEEKEEVKKQNRLASEVESHIKKMKNRDKRK